MTYQQAAEIWQGYVGSQTPEEFIEISRQEGHATTEEAVAAYVAQLPRMFGQSYTHEELQEAEAGLIRYLAEHGF